MVTSTVEIRLSPAVNVSVSDDTLSVDLADGRTLSVPLEWFPRLTHATIDERSAWQISGNGDGIRWDGLDEDVSIEGLLAGRPSGETQASLKRWLGGRHQS